ncbi:MAG: hypothetical protein ABI162_00230 [Luteolibacter sp.]
MTDGIKRTIFVIAAVVAVAVMFSIWWFIHRSEIPVPNENAVAMELLVEKLSGPGYFNAPVTGTPDADGPWIVLEDVRSQKDRVILERHWGGSERVELDRLISQLAEPKPERMVGGYRILLERLNLALDAIKK